jgi:hypothetical protein
MSVLLQNGVAHAATAERVMLTVTPWTSRGHVLLEFQLGEQRPFCEEHFFHCTGLHFPSRSVYVRNGDQDDLRRLLRGKRRPSRQVLESVPRPDEKAYFSSHHRGTPGPGGQPYDPLDPSHRGQPWCSLP